MPITYETFGASYDATTYEGSTLTYDGVEEEEESEIALASTSGGGRGGGTQSKGSLWRGWTDYVWEESTNLLLSRNHAVDVVVGLLLLDDD